MIQVQQSKVPSDFYNGLDLLSRKARLTLPVKSTLLAKDPIALIKRKRWESEIPWPSKIAFQERLAADGFTEDMFADTLSAPLHLLAEKGEVPPWMTTIEKCYNSEKQLVNISLPPEIERHPLRPFLKVALPLLEDAILAMRKGLGERGAPAEHEHLQRVHTDAVIDSLIPQLAGKILGMISRTLVLELHVSKMGETLSGTTPEERFSSFANQFNSRKRSYRLFKEYPVLAQQLVQTIGHWKEFTSLFLGHLHQDYEVLMETFFKEADPGPLTACDMGVGDGHRGGKSVVLLTFQSGQRLVYKPRSLSIDTHFYKFLGWLNDHGDHPPFATIPLLDKGEYGWMAFIEPRSCTCKEELANFYFRQGGYLALLYALEAVDFHYENIIAQGEHPFLIDLESLFQPRIEMNTNKEELALTQKIAFSVLRVGLLPVHVYSENGHDDADFSGLGSSAGQVSPRKQPTWEKTGTDEIRMVKKNLEMGAGLNRPKLHGETVEILDYAQHILNGFQKIYRIIVEHREELLAPHGPLMAFLEDDVRVIFRPTRIYATLQQESFHPDVLRNGLDRDLLFDQLWQSTQEQPFLNKLIPQELRDLREGDIPLFLAKAGGKEIHNCYGEALGFQVDRSGIQGAAARIQQMDENDFERQSWFVKASLSTLAMSAELTKMASYPFQIQQQQATTHELIRGAQLIGDRLCKLAIHNQGDVAWIGMSITPELKWVISPLAENIYGGRAGIILFLAHLEKLTGDAKYRRLAEKAFFSLKKQLDRGSHDLFAIGAYSGWGGMLYLMVELGQLWNQPNLIEEAKGYIPEMMQLLEKDQYFDVLYGAAGGIVSLLALYEASPEPGILENARVCGEYLLEHQITADGGAKAWVVPMAGAKPLAGFSHGAAGTAWALFKLAQVCGDMRFANAAKEAIRYEREIFCEDFGNWPDLRTMGTQRPSRHRDGLRFMNAWCHGASGVALGRLGTPEDFQDAAYREEISTAIKTTRSNGFGGSHCLCHGDLGNLEMMHLASLRWKDSKLHKEVMQRAKGIVASFPKHGHLCGIPLGVETPGMMNGLAGIGYQLIRLAKPDQVPSILILESSSSLGSK